MYVCKSFVSVVIFYLFYVHNVKATEDEREENSFKPAGDDKDVVSCTIIVSFIQLFHVIYYIWFFVL